MSNLEIMENWLKQEYTVGFPQNVFNIIRNKLPKEFRKKTWVIKAGFIIHRLSEMPLYT